MLQSKADCEASLIEFVKQAWHVVDSSEYQECWAIDALCEHLQAVTDGRIRKLLINFPPRCGKTTVTSICWPVWTWIQQEHSYLAGPHVDFLCGSYGQRLTEENSNAARQLIGSAWFQERWGHVFTLRKDQNTKTNFANDKGGKRLSTSVGGSLIGLGGSIINVDDPHNTQQVESEPDRLTVSRWWKEVRSTRLNDPKRSAIVCVMQRLHEVDVSGLILSGEDSEEWTHLMIPMEYDSSRACRTSLGIYEDADGELEELEWEDPRDEDGELMWPERFGPDEVRNLKRELGPYMASGRLQQQPTPSGGGIIRREWWRLWDEQESALHGIANGLFPPFEYVVASVDTAYTEKEENDPSALTIWGVWKDNSGNRRLMLCGAWANRYELNALVVEIVKTVKRFKPQRVLIEAKAAGISVAQEIRRLHARETWSVQLIDPGRGDKVARAYAVQNLFEAGLVYAPDRTWSELVIAQCETFPKGKFDDLVDTVTQALAHLRLIGMAELPEERLAEIDDELRNWKPAKALYEV